MDRTCCFMEQNSAVCLFYGKLLSYNLWNRMSLLWNRMSLLWNRMSLLWNRMSLLWNRMSLLWNRMLLIMHETAALQDRPGRHPGPRVGTSIGTSIGTCLSPNRQGTPGSPACARYGTETQVMEQKRRLWNKSVGYGTKATFMEQKRPLWNKSVVLWNKKFTYGTEVLVCQLYGTNSETYGKKKIPA